MRVVEITAYTVGGVFVVAVLAATIWVTVAILLDALADWLIDAQTSVARAAAWFRRHGA